MLATTISFSEPDPATPGGPWVAMVTVSGSGFVTRALALFAFIGDVDVQNIVLSPDASGFTGLLATLPNDGDALSVGFSNLMTTDLVYHTGDIA
jgi:hypothetical protein